MFMVDKAWEMRDKFGRYAEHCMYNFKRLFPLAEEAGVPSIDQRLGMLDRS